MTSVLKTGKSSVAPTTSKPNLQSFRAKREPSQQPQQQQEASGLFGVLASLERESTEAAAWTVNDGTVNNGTVNNGAIIRTTNCQRHQTSGLFGVLASLERESSEATVGTVSSGTVNAKQADSVASPLWRESPARPPPPRGRAPALAGRRASPAHPPG